MGLLEITPAAPKATCSPQAPLHSDASHAALFTMKRPHRVNRALEVPLYISAGHHCGSPFSGPPGKPRTEKDDCVWMIILPGLISRSREASRWTSVYNPIAHLVASSQSLAYAITVFSFFLLMIHIL